MSQFPYDRQQPAWISASTEETQVRVRAFIRSVYAWMAGGLLITTFAALWVSQSAAMRQLIFGNRGVLIFLLIAEFGLVLFLSFRIQKMSAGTAAASFLVYSLLNGLILSGIFIVYTAASIFQAFAAAAGMFGAMAIYGLFTKRDLTSWGSFFFMGLIGIVVCSVVNIFLRSDALSWTISFIGVFVFLGLTAWDNQKLKSMAVASGPTENYAVIGALSLYLDFINLFLIMLRIFGGRRD